MNIIPAIDLKDGKAVRLYKGEMSSAKIYGEAVHFAQEFESMGAKWLHIVDLNGAFAGSPQNLAHIKNIRKSCNLLIELGGGIRDEDTIRRYIDLGINRVILGSIAASNPHFVRDMACKYPIAVGIDARDGFVSINGWASDSNIYAASLAREFRGSNVEAIICTDINKDGTLEGINVAFSEEIHKASRIPTIASGGFASQKDIESLLQNNNVSGVIVGKAFYEGKIDLRKFLQCN